MHPNTSNRLRLTAIATEGMTSADRLVSLSPVTVLRGGNGAGKSTILNAIRILTGRKIPGLPNTPDGRMRLARGDSLTVRGWFVTPDGRELTAIRTSERVTDGRGKVTVTETVSGSLVPRGTRRAGEALEGLLGAWAEVWAPDDLIAESPAKLRRRLIDLLGAGDPAPYLPTSLPSWAKPNDGEAADEWISRVIAKAKRNVLDLEAEHRTIEAKLADSAFLAGVPGATDPIQTRLASLRAAQRSAQARADLERRHREATGRLESLQAKRIEDAPSVAEARAALETAAAAKAEADRAAAAWNRTAETRAKIERRLAGLAPGPRAVDVPPATPEQLTAAEVSFLDARRVVGERKAALSGARQRLAGLGEAARIIGECPACHADLEAHLDEAKDAALAQIAALESAVERAQASDSAATDAFNAARRGVEMAAVLAERAKLEAELAELPAEGSLTHVAIDLASARTAVEVAERQTALVTEIDRAGLAVDRLTAELDDTAPPDQDAAAIEAAIRSAEEDLRTAGEAAQRAKDRETLLADRDLSVEQIRRAKADLTRWVAIDREMLAGIRIRLEGPASRIAGDLVTVELEDARGNPTCRLAVDGVDVSTLSGGERLTFLPALLTALGERSSAPWRPLPVDGCESISADRRAAFAVACVSAVRSGAIDQVILAGCPDSWPTVDGVQVIDLDAPGPSPTGSDDREVTHAA